MKLSVRHLAPLLALALCYATALSYPRPSLAPPAFTSLAGQLLVANRHLADPNFARCVVYMVAHSEEGAMGLVVNRRYGTVTLQKLFGDFGAKAGGNRPVALYYGGPVESERGFILHSDDYTGAGTQLFRNGIALSGDLEIVRAVAEDAAPSRCCSWPATPAGVPVRWSTKWPGTTGWWRRPIPR